MRILGRLFLLAGMMAFALWTGAAAQESVVLGDEQFDVYLPLLEGKRVALFSNQSGIVGNRILNAVEPEEGTDTTLIPFGRDAGGNEVTYGEHILDALISRGIQVSAVFCPEHGFRNMADAGSTINDSVDEKTGVPLLSLYSGNTNYPSEEAMETFDVLVIDIQDVGVRFYTYWISMSYLMDACASHGKEVILLDRPNPNGFCLDGPVLKEPFASGVGKYPIPMAYGMTLGELARMINGEGWLNAGKDACNLTVIPCQNYTHQTRTDLICAPSPNLKDMRAIYLYPSICLFENTSVSVGRGTQMPFEIYGSPLLEGNEKYPFSFIPESMPGATDPPMKGQECFGRDLREKPVEEIWQEGIQLDYLIEAYHAVTEEHPEVSFFGKSDSQGRYWLDKLCGTDQVRRMIEEGHTAGEIRATWTEELEKFRGMRSAYLLYAD
ncbi:MAG: DUF1343 domain-containing protein [Clostridia bacterium]|nr:DUF1343 domain-containing protein [Clostridia bacterium]